MKRLLVHFVLLAVAMAVTAHFVPGVHVESLRALAIASVVLGLVNALVRPILSLLTLPLTILTLGIFYLLVNGACFALAARVVDGFSVEGVLPAVEGALVTSVVSTVLGWFFGPSEDDD